MPVRLPPGLLRATTRPAFTGSAPVLNTMGIVAVASLAANTVGKLPVAAITATWRRTRSAAQARQSIELGTGPAILNRDIPAFGETGFVQPLTERCREIGVRLGRCISEKPHHRHRWLLRARRERPRRRRAAAKQDHEIAPSY